MVLKCIQKGLYVFPDEITHLNKYTCLIDILGYIEDIIMLSKGFILCKSFIISPKQKFLDRHEYYFTWSPGFQLIFKRTRTSEASKVSPISSEGKSSLRGSSKYSMLVYFPKFSYIPLKLRFILALSNSPKICSAMFTEDGNIGGNGNMFLGNFRGLQT